MAASNAHAASGDADHDHGIEAISGHAGHSHGPNANSDRRLLMIASD